MAIRHGQGNSALLALPLLALRWRHLRVESRQLAILGLAWLVAVVVPLSLAQQKSEWHLNMIIPGAAWLVGAALASLPTRLLRVAPAVLLAASLAWSASELQGTSPANHRQLAINAVTSTPAALQGRTRWSLS